LRTRPTTDELKAIGRTTESCYSYVIFTCNLV